MSRILFPLALLFFTLISFAKVQTETLSVYFETDKHELTDEAKTQLQELVSDIEPDADFSIQLKGHTDDIGQYAYNDALSARRSNVVRNYLIHLGIDQSMMEVASFGEHRPKLPNSSESHRDRNRRVEIYLTIYHFDSMSELEETLNRDNITEFTIDPTENNVLKGRQGVNMIIESNSFVDSEGNPVSGDVKVTLREALSMDDFVSYNLTTVSGDRMLESGGMFRVTAETENGEPLNLNPDRPITTAVVADRVQDDMQLFTSGTGGQWDRSETKISTKTSLDLPPYPNLEFVSYALPVYKRDLSSKPQEPESRGKPLAPRAPDWEQYEPDIRWYQFLFKGHIERKAQERYQEAMARYQKKVELYDRRYELFVEHNSEWPRKMREYKLALKKWNKQCVQDSLDMINGTEYKRLLEERRLRIADARAQHEREVAEWEAIRRQRLGEMAEKLDEMGVSDEQVVNTYMFAMSDLKWINIDRFLKLDRNQTRMITLKDVDDSQEKVFLVFKNIKSMLPMMRKELMNNYVRDRVPTNEDVSILAYKVKDGKTMVYHEEVDPKRTKYKMEYQPYTFKELQTLLKELQS